jgi:hypothetical protein
VQGSQRLVFTHIAKAGGSSVNGLLHYPMVECAASTLAFAGSTTTYADPGLPRRLVREHGLELDEFQIILGHLPFATARSCFGAATFVTTLRDPRWQLISSYCSQPANQILANFGMEDFVAQVEGNPRAEWAIDNYQVRTLCDTPDFECTATEAMLESAKRNLKQHYTIVGFADRLDEFAQALGTLFAMDGRLPAISRLNETGHYHNHVTKEHLAFAERRNALDMRFYAWTRKQFPEIRVGKSISQPCRGRPCRKLSIGPGVFEVNYMHDGRAA